LISLEKKKKDFEYLCSQELPTDQLEISTVLSTKRNTNCSLPKHELQFKEISVRHCGMGRGKLEKKFKLR
jgi:hypothetical protein